MSRRRASPVTALDRAEVRSLEQVRSLADLLEAVAAQSKPAEACRLRRLVATELKRVGLARAK